MGGVGGEGELEKEGKKKDMSVLDNSIITDFYQR